MSEQGLPEGMFPKSMVKEDTPLETTQEPTAEVTEETAKETPAVEQESKVEEEKPQKQEINLESDTTEKEERSLQTEKPSLSDDDFISFAKERWGVESLEDIEKRLKAETSEFQFADPFVEKLNQYVAETGRTPQDYYATQTMDIDSFSDEDIVKAGLRQENPELKDSDIDLLYKRQFGQKSIKEIDEDVMDESEIQAINEAKEDNEYRRVLLQKQASKFRKDFKDMQEKYRLPVENKQEEVSTPATDDIPSFDTEEFTKTAREAISELESIELDDFTFKLSDEHRSKVAEGLFTPDQFLDQFFDENGDFNASEWTGFVASQILENDFYKATTKSKSDEAVESVVKEMKNTTLDAKTTPDSNEKVTTSLSDFLSKL